MNTKFIYMIALLSLATSSLSFAAPLAPRAKKLKYQTSSPVSATEATRAEACTAAKEQMQNQPRAEDGCVGRGESGAPLEIEPDSGCVCQPAIATSPSLGAIECTFGVHWYCAYSEKAAAK